MSSFELTHDDATTELSPGWTLRAPGIVGHGEFTLTAPGARRAPNTTSLGLLDQALANVDVSERAVVEFTIEPTSTVVARRRGGEIGAAELIELDIPPPPENFEQVVLEASENGVVHWHVNYETEKLSDRRSGGLIRRYRIPISASANQSAPGDRRGLFSAIARRVLKVLVFPITDFAVGIVGKGIARAWEAKHAPYGIRKFEPSDFQQPGAKALTPDDWARLGSGPALLFVHGTFSTAHGGFSRLPRQTLETLSQRYGGRTIAFDHWTLSHDPKDNVNWFLKQIPAGVSLDVDIICHSRGGLVSRVLASAVADANGMANRLKVGRIVFVATPNDGTLLADPDHMVEMLDRYTNIVQFLPDGPVEIVLEAVITAVKTIVHAGLKHLPGLSAQVPEGDFIEWLVSSPQSSVKCFAIAADWEPTPGSPLVDLVKQTVADQVMDRVFEDAENDLVVPTLGVAGGNGPGFPIDSNLVHTFQPDAGAIHTNLFGFEDTSKRLLEWLVQRDN